MGFEHWQTFDNCFILFPFKGTRRINQASAGTEVWERPLDHLALSPLKHWYVGRLEAPFDFRISRQSAGAGAGNIEQNAIEAATFTAILKSAPDINEVSVERLRDLIVLQDLGAQLRPLMSWLSEEE